MEEVTGPSNALQPPMTCEQIQEQEAIQSWVDSRSSGPLEAGRTSRDAANNAPQGEGSAHTPGPWQFNRNHGVIHGTPWWGGVEEVAAGAPFEGCSVNDIYQVCTLKRLHVYDYSIGEARYPAREDVKARVAAMYEANARLIAAAPELLEALRAAASALPDEQGLTTGMAWKQEEAGRIVRAAIAKALGK